MGCLKITALVVAAIAALFPILISQLIGGWVRKYTSPVSFSQKDIPDLSGKIAIVTGANTGIGYESALEMARNGAKVVVCSRNAERGQNAVKKITSDIANSPIKGEAVFMQLDLSSFKSIEAFASEFIALNWSLDILMLNAGIMKSPGEQYVGQKMSYGYEETADGFETHIGVNHIGHQYLTKLIDKTISQNARIVSVSSAAESGAYKGAFRYDLWRSKGDDYEDGLAYGQSKLANVMFARELAERMKDRNVIVTSCHPGVIMTELDRYMKPHLKEQFSKVGQWFALLNAGLMLFFEQALFNQADGALTQLHLATSVEPPVNGGFYHPIGQLVQSSHPDGQSAKKQKELWKQTEEAILTVIERRRN